MHAPYVLNVATTNNRIRIPAGSSCSSTCRPRPRSAPPGLIVHGGHVLKNDDPAVGFDNWRKCIDGLEMTVPLLIENTAGGDNAMARRLERIARLWDAIGAAKGGDTVGFCLDTCHAHAGGEELVGWSTGSRRSPAGSTWCTPTTRATRSTPVRIGTPTSVTARWAQALAEVVRQAGRARGGGDAGRPRGSGRRHRLAARSPRSQA